MITRIWHGWTTPGNADIYEAMLREEIFVGIERRRIPGFKSIRLLRRSAGQEVEFITVMFFDSIDAIKAVAGPDYETSIIPEERRKYLSRHDAKATHYEVVSVHEVREK
jgi:antibiotic biosynthesis monooxygenase (ABM) superfamily enzyme